MKTLRFGDTGSLVSLLQTALRRAGTDPGPADGIFGPATQAAVRAFQRAAGLTGDGVAGPKTHAALEPWYLGRFVHAVRPGDSLWRIAEKYGASLLALETANPALDPYDLRPGTRLVVPLPFDVVPADIPVSSELAAFCVRGLAARYPFLRTGQAGQSVLGRPLWTLRLGEAPRRVLFNAAHHANEWITATLLLRWCEELCAASAADGAVGGVSARALLAAASVTLVPLVNPDGVDLVTGALNAEETVGAAELAARYPQIPFPDGWKANLRGVDLNLQYPALWDRARELKFAQGYTAPGPRDYVGSGPLTAPESRALYDYTLALDPALTLAYHTQGGEIYWKFMDYRPEGALALAERFAAASGYAVADPPPESSFAGYKDWFLQNYDRPGYTIEAGRGENPLPLEQFGEIYRDNAGLLALAVTG